MMMTTTKKIRTHVNTKNKSDGPEMHGDKDDDEDNDENQDDNNDDDDDDSDDLFDEPMTLKMTKLMNLTKLTKDEM